MSSNVGLLTYSQASEIENGRRAAHHHGQPTSFVVITGSTLRPPATWSLPRVASPGGYGDLLPHAVHIKARQTSANIWLTNFGRRQSQVFVNSGAPRLTDYAVLVQTSATGPATRPPRALSGCAHRGRTLPAFLRATSRSGGGETLPLTAGGPIDRRGELPIGGGCAGRN